LSLTRYNLIIENLKIKYVELSMDLTTRVNFFSVVTHFNVTNIIPLKNFSDLKNLRNLERSKLDVKSKTY